MRLGYNTNGLAHHRLTDAIELLAEEGYQSVAITLDAGALDPFEDPHTLTRQIKTVRTMLDRCGLSRVVETGARFLLNPRLKHDPTLMDPDPAGGRSAPSSSAEPSTSPASSTPSASHSGRDDARIRRAKSVVMDRLAKALRPSSSTPKRCGIALAFEPEPGMFIDTFERFHRLDQQVRHPLFHLTVDLGHVHCIESGTIAEHLRRWGPRILNIHIEDMVRGVHEHLMFGQGTIDFPPVFAALREVGYDRGVHVELSRHSHAAVEAVRAARGFLSPFFSAAS